MFFIFHRGENVMMAEEEYVEPESNWGRRYGAYFIDLAVIFLLIYAIFLLLTRNFLVMLPYPFETAQLMFFFFFWALYGVLTFLYSGAFEGGIGATVGKGVQGLEVFSLDTEYMTAGKGLKRSLSKLVFFAPIIDKAAASDIGDPRQRKLDISANTIVGDFIPPEAPMPEPRGGPIYVNLDKLAEQGAEEDDEFSDLPIPRELLSGRCPYCSTPYNIIPSKDKSTWSGLWGSRCIWCNKKVLEQYRSRVQPGKWI
jgi:uncharacterized RDD family membrane protein YckC